MSNKMNTIGMMQGRLSLPRAGRIQSFPLETWREEFFKARDCGLQTIEWIFEADQWEKNPIITEAGVREIQAISNQTGVGVVTVCADYFMDRPLLRVDSNALGERIQMFGRLMERCEQLGVQYVGIPFVDASAINGQDEIRQTTTIIQSCLQESRSRGIVLALETNLGPLDFAQLLCAFDPAWVGVNYDIGNSASLDYNPVEEFEAYGDRIATVHIKDRVKFGRTVPLGTGSANFDIVFGRLAKNMFQGPFIFQAAREEEGSETLTAKKNLVWLKKYWV